MVPHKINFSANNDDSSLDMMISLFKKLINLAQAKKKILSQQNWESLEIITKEQNEMLFDMDQALKCLPQEQKASSSKSETLKLLITQYREEENCNRKMLDDALYVAKIKVKNFFPLETSQGTYNHLLKKESDLFKENPLLLNEVV